MRELPSRPDLEHYRNEAKAFVRAFRAGDAAARERAVAVLGADAGRRFLLSDAQFVLAHEHGMRSWSELRRAVQASPLARLAQLERGEIAVDSGLVYGDGEPVEVLVRKRLHRYVLSDQRRAVEKAGQPPGWREAAETACLPMNVDRQGTVFVPASRAATSESLVVRLADASRAVHEALLVWDEHGR